MTPTPEQVATALHQHRHHSDWCPPAWWVCPDHIEPFVARKRRGTRGAACPTCAQACAEIVGVTP